MTRDRRATGKKGACLVVPAGETSNSIILNRNLSDGFYDFFTVLWRRLILIVYIID
jgi:hypothetical protein